jgi:hypothetical protein
MAMKRLTLAQRQEAFEDLVRAQDAGLPVARSRQMVAEKYDITEEQLRAIEDEGLDNEWPPLSEAPFEQEQEVG